MFTLNPDDFRWVASTLPVPPAAEAPAVFIDSNGNLQEATATSRPLKPGEEPSFQSYSLVLKRTVFGSSNVPDEI